MAKFPRYLWIKNRRLYLYEKYDTWNTALSTAKHYQKKLKNNYFILKVEDNWGAIFYGLYMNKVFRWA